jgi:hypothetical protein
VLGLKAVFLHSGNDLPSIPVGYAVLYILVQLIDLHMFFSRGSLFTDAFTVIETGIMGSQLARAMCLYFIYLCCFLVYM